MRHKALYAVFVFALILAAGATVAAQDCRNSDFRGAFNALALGDFIVTPPGIPPGPTARIGRVVTDGDGNAHITAVLSLNGAILAEDYGGTYDVHPDCTVDVTLLIPFPGAPQPIPFKFFGMLADSGRELSILLLDPPGSTVHITLRKQQRRDCANHDLNGSYLLNMSGVSVFLPNLPAGTRFARVGIVNFDGNSSFDATTKASIGGLIVDDNFSGVYNIDSNCGVKMAYTSGGQAYSWDGFLSDYSNTGQFIISSPQGAVITGTLRQK